MPEKTKVLYDVSQAIQELDKLDRKVDKSGKKAKQGFEKHAQGLDKLGQGFSRLNPKVGAGISQMGKFGSAVGATGAAVAGAAVAVGVLAANAFGLSEALRNAEDVAGRFLEKADKIQNIQDKISAAEDAGRNFEFLAAREAIAEQRLALTQAQIRADARRDSAREEVEIEQDKLRQIEALQQAQARKTLDAERRLNQKRAELAGDSNAFGGEAAGRRVVSLAAKAQQEAQRGNVDNAEALIEKAKELSAELGNHVFFTDKIDAANKSVLRALEKDVQDSKKKESTLATQAKEQDRVSDAAKRRLEFEEAVRKKLADQLKLLGAQSGLISKRRKFEQQLQQTDQGARELTAGQRGTRGEVLNVAAEGGLARGLDVLNNNLRRILDFSNITRSEVNQGQVGRLEADVLREVLKTQKELSRGEVIESGQRLEGLRGRFEDIKLGLDTGVISEVVRQPLERLEPILRGLERQLGAGGNLGAVGLNETVGTAQSRLRESADAAQAQVKQVTSNVTINANVKGGVFDNDTMKQFEDRIRRIVRQEQSKLQ